MSISGARWRMERARSSSFGSARRCGESRVAAGSGERQQGKGQREGEGRAWRRGIRAATMPRPAHAAVLSERVAVQAHSLRRRLPLPGALDARVQGRPVAPVEDPPGEGVLRVLEHDAAGPCATRRKSVAGRPSGIAR